MSPPLLRPTPLFFLLVFGLILVMGLPAQSRWSVELGLAHTTVPGHWAPLRLEAGSAGGPWDLEAWGRGPTAQEFRLGRWDLPGAGVFERPIFLPDGLETLRLVRRDSLGEVSEQSLPVLDLAFPGHLIVVDGVGTGVQDQLARILQPKEPVRVVELSPSRWPSSFLAWGAVSAVVVSDPGPVLSPAQVIATRAWLSSGGRLVVLERRPGSLLSQIGEDLGLGQILTSTAALHLEPYGSSLRLGTDFEPDPPLTKPHPGATTAPAVGFLLVWVLTAGLLVFRKKPKVGTLTLASVLSLAAAGLFFLGGAFVWDRGIGVHSRQVVLPGSAGVITSVVARKQVIVDGLTGLPTVSPWGLELWTRSRQGLALQRFGDEAVTFFKWGRESPRVTDYRIRDTSSGLAWTQQESALETAPERFAPDLRWLARVASAAPGREWAVGWEPSPDGGELCWISLLPQGERP